MWKRSHSCIEYKIYSRAIWSTRSNGGPVELKVEEGVVLSRSSVIVGCGVYISGALWSSGYKRGSYGELYQHDQVFFFSSVNICRHRFIRLQNPISWPYSTILLRFLCIILGVLRLEVSVWISLNHMEGAQGGIVFYQVFLLSPLSVQYLNCRNCKNLREFEEIEISRQSFRGDCE